MILFLNRNQCRVQSMAHACGGPIFPSSALFVGYNIPVLSPPHALMKEKFASPIHGPLTGRGTVYFAQQLHQ
jgi:hypothetical protein